MKIDLALRHRQRAMQRLKDAFSLARSVRCTSTELHTMSREARAMPAGAPSWCTAYLEGADSILMDALYREALEYCSRAPSGELVSHHRESERYYEKRGFSPRETAGNGGGGHYWKDTDRPFYVSPPA